LSNQLLSHQRLGAGFCTYVLACPLAWMLVTEWGPGYVQLVSSSSDMRRPDAHQGAAWESRPVRVLAEPQWHRLSLQGDMGWGSAAALERALREYPQTQVLELESPGGFVHESDLMVDLVQLHGLDTLARGRCASACTEVFLAGRRRFVGPQARFGFHQSGYEGRAQDTQWSTTEYEASILYRAKGVSADFAAQALNTSYYGLWRPPLLEVKRAHFATHWWSERPPEYD
jgi:membrane-bound ClpP family serine protease